MTDDTRCPCCEHCARAHRLWARLTRRGHVYRCQERAGCSGSIPIPNDAGVVSGA